MKDNDSRIKKIVEQQVRKILAEAEPTAAPESGSAVKEKPKGKITRGTIGSGKIKNKINDAKALATKNPKELMKRLGVSGASGNSIAAKVLSVVRSAIYGTDTMREAYLGAAFREGKVYISPREISPRDGALYMLHTLTAADNLDMLGTYDNEIVVSVGEEGIVIQFK